MGIRGCTLPHAAFGTGKVEIRDIRDLELGAAIKVCEERYQFEGSRYICKEGSEYSAARSGCHRDRFGGYALSCCGQEKWAKWRMRL